MEFIDRIEELNRLRGVSAQGEGALVVIWGRRRIGKSRLLVEWCRATSGLYWVADESASAIQRRYFSQELERLFPGFAAVTYPDWTSLLDRLSTEASRRDWHGPLVIDEFPYLVATAPELPSALQRWIDAEKRNGGVVCAVAGSSQRMMMDIVLNQNAPLFGRADQLFRLGPLPAGSIPEMLRKGTVHDWIDFYTCWGGVPRYWELAVPFGLDRYDALDELVLSPMGVLHDEVERLLRMEMPAATALRPILDAIGLGAHRISEIAARLQVPATSLSRGIKQLRDLGYIEREIPFGEDEKRAKKALYRLADPFLRLWFRLVAPNRGTLFAAHSAVRRELVTTAWGQLRAAAWEDLCRRAVPRLGLEDRAWGPAGRYWSGTASEWDIVCTSLDGEAVILGECTSLDRPARESDLRKIIAAVKAKTAPQSIAGQRHIEYLVCVPELDGKAQVDNCMVVEGRQIFAALRD